jgi:alpha-galactosidase
MLWATGPVWLHLALAVLLGPRVPVFADHVELSDQGIDFASEIGTGGIPATKFVWPEEDALHPRLSEWWGLSPEKEALWKKWLDIASRHRLAEGEYLNLYDLAFDAPEAHVVLKDGKLYYAFYTPHYGETYEGRLVLRGLQSMRYSLYDYVNGNNLGQVNGPVAEIKSNFKSALLIRATPMA